jgi:hypothetical protein
MGAGDTTVVSKHGVKSQWTVLNGSPQRGFHQSCCGATIVACLRGGARGAGKEEGERVFWFSPNESPGNVSSSLSPSSGLLSPRMLVYIHYDCMRTRRMRNEFYNN